jgi:acylphosphatase
VFFRDSTQEVARRAGCSGWVRNLPGGRVEIEVQGPADAVAEVVEHCRTGPPRAVVTDVEIAERPVVGDERGFEVR